VYVESDAVGGYLVNRLNIPNTDDDVVMLGYSSDVINEYFTARELGQEAAKPGTGVETDVRQALGEVLHENSGLWVRAVDAVLGVEPDAWRRWRKFRRRHRKGGRFVLTSELTLEAAEHTALGLERDTLLLKCRRRSNQGARET
jgi:hypothetical protein